MIQIGSPRGSHGPAGELLRGNLPAFRRDPLSFLSAAARSFGPVVCLRFGRTSAYLLNDPSLLEEVLVTRRRDFIKSKALLAQHRLLGNGLLTNENESWLEQRRLAQPSFHRDRIAAYGDVIAHETQRMLATWEEGRVRDIYSEMQRLTLTIVGKTLFGADVEGKAATLGASIEAAMTQYSNRRGLARLVPEWVPLRSHRRYREGIRDIDSTIAEIIRERRAREDDSGDLLSALLHARDEDGATMNDKQLRDEAVTLFVGGFDTPSLALSWAWYLLARHPEAEEELASEIQSLQGRPPRAQDLQRLPFTEMVVKESMRLYPPAWLLSREAVRDSVIGGHSIPAGAVVLMSQWVMHRDGRFFDAPDSFVPGRWRKGGPLSELPRFAYFPFGGGPRVCIGASFAMMEAVLVLATITQRFRFTLAEQREVVPWPSMTLRLKGGLNAVITRRRADHAAPPNRVRDEFNGAKVEC